MAQGNQPEAKFRIGNITASVWINDNKFYTLTLQRSYKDNGEWKNTDSFGHADLLNVAKLCERAERWIDDQYDIANPEAR